MLFNRDIRPILSENCFACHGPDRNKRQANLRLDDPASALRPAILVPGHPEKSALVQRVTSTGGAMMPPVSSGKKLTVAQIALLKRWVQQGAKYQQHWAYVPPVRPAVPRLSGKWLAASGKLNPIDAFVRAKLAEKGILPSPEADRRTLIRRVYLDLIGVPPTPEQVAAFVAERSRDAYEKIVDRLLADRRYGERMAAPWLDIVRYADTVGYHGDQNMNAWAYRDYVIDSFNENKPFDQFTREQLAGDLLPNPTPETLTATCFNRLNMVTREGGAQPKEYLAKYAADRVRTVSMAWLGSTMGCCECHDHKYDPFKQKDFYSMAAFFADIKQWGVYQDYDYTPNPELKGWSNDHPFPPEIKVESPYLKQRILNDQARIRQLAVQAGYRLVREQTARRGYEEWRKSVEDLLRRSPDGWRAPAEQEVVGADGKPAAAKPYSALLPDGTLLVDNSAPADIGVSLKPGAGWTSSLKLDLLPHASHGGSILRPGSGSFLRVAIKVVHPDGKSENLGVRQANAAHYELRYYNGFDLIGVQGGWQLGSAHLKEADPSLWILDKPVKLADGDRLLVSFRGAKVGCLKVATSPIAPDDPYALQFSPELLQSLRDRNNPGNEPAALEVFVRSTAWEPEAYAQVKKLDADILECRHGAAPVMVVQAMNPLTVRVLPRGNWQDESGAIVEPAVPSFLPHASVPPGRRLTRLDLARWLTSPENPLTARMFVNRLWKQFFGTALSDKVEDLGTQGEWPTHPELLDWLACEFRDGSRQSAVGSRQTGAARSKPDTRHPTPWDVKHMVRLIVTSATYRQSSKPRPELALVDPNNRLLAYQNPRRLEAEFIRDNALAISGLINYDMGGPPCKPYQPAGYYGNLQFPDREYQPDQDDRQWRRGIYMHWQRTFLHPMLANFDAPSREDCIAARTVANTPQQALTLLNDPEFVEASRAFALRLLTNPGGDADKLERAYEMALCRPIKPSEKQSLLAFLAKVRQGYRNLPEDGKKLMQVGYSPAPKGDPIEEAGWTSVCRVILNLHETITRY